MNKKGWTATDYVTALILFSAVIGLVYLMVGALASDYDTPGIVDSSFESNYDKLTENTQLVDKMLSATTNKTGFSLFNTADIMISSTFSVTKLIFGSFSTIKDQLLHIPEDFNIPTQVTSIAFVTILAIITVTVLFIIINALNKTNKL